MKLITRTSLFYLFFSLLTYIIIGAAFYFVTNKLIHSEVDDRLQMERMDFERFFARHNNWNNSYNFVEDKVSLQRSSVFVPGLTEFKDTVMLNKYSGQEVRFRQIGFNVKRGSGIYKVRIRKSILESDKLVAGITMTMVALFGTALIVMFFLQEKISRDLWKPFYRTLKSIKEFHLSDTHELKFNGNNIQEFEELNTELKKMTRKMRRDYRGLKEFTENAAHEIQTPLALINGRVEELIQSEGFSEQQMYRIQEIYEASGRISKMYQALSLLSKIENRQFNHKLEISFTALAIRKLEEYEDMLQHKTIEVSVNIEEDFLVKMNPGLTEILVNNLFSNAIRHNFNGGRLHVQITRNSFAVHNSGKEPTADPKQFFERFKKENQASESLGLGLAIVKQICENDDLQLSYVYEGGWHKITLSVL